METVDLSYVFNLMDNADEKALLEKKEYYKGITKFAGYPEEKLTNLARFGVAIDILVDELSLNALAIRC